MVGALSRSAVPVLLLSRYAQQDDAAWRAVLLDVGDTLVHWGVPKPERLAWVCAQAGFALPADPDLVRRAAIAGEQHLTAAFGRFSLASEDGWRGFYQTVLAVLGCPSTAAEALARHHVTLRAPWSVDPDAVLVLRELRQRGYRIGLVSVWEAPWPPCAGRGH